MRFKEFMAGEDKGDMRQSQPETKSSAIMIDRTVLQWRTEVDKTEVKKKYASSGKASELP
jgi:hypothetical protein